LTMVQDNGTTKTGTSYALKYDNGKYVFENAPSNSSLAAGAWNMTFAVVKASTVGEAPTYAESLWSGIDYTYTTSPDLLVKIYTGQTTTLDAEIIEENLAYGIINGTVNGNIQTTVTTQITSGSDTVLSSSVTPASASSETVSVSNKTTVTIPKEVKDFTTDSKAALTITATPIVAANSMFTISDNTGAVGAIDLSATVSTTVDGTTTTTPVTEFKDSSNQAVAVTVETYIAKGMSNVTVKYNGTGDAPKDVTYDATTGKLTFKTTHFSTFLVGADEVAYVKSNNTAYTTIEEALKHIQNNDVISLLKDATLSSNISIEQSVTLDLNSKTLNIMDKCIELKKDSACFLTLANGTIKASLNKGLYDCAFGVYYANSLCLDHIDFVQSCSDSVLYWNGLLYVNLEDEDEYSAGEPSLTIKNSNLEGTDILVDVSGSLSNESKVANVSIIDSVLNSTGIGTVSISCASKSNITGSTIKGTGNDILSFSGGTHTVKDTTIESNRSSKGNYSDSALSVGTNNGGGIYCAATVCVENVTLNVLSNSDVSAIYIAKESNEKIPVLNGAINAQGAEYNIYYVTNENALKAALNGSAGKGSVVKLLNDINLSEGLNLTVSKTLDMNGHNIKCIAPITVFSCSTSGVTLVLKNSSYNSSDEDSMSLIDGSITSETGTPEECTLADFSNDSNYSIEDGVTFINAKE